MSVAQNLAVFRDAVVAELKARVPGVKSIEAHGGTFRDEDLKLFATLAPAVRVAIMGCGSCQRHSSGEVRVPINLVAVVVTRDTVDADQQKLSRDVQALLIANAVSLVVFGNRFGLSGVFQPEDLRAENMYSGHQVGSGIALWQVTWTQPVLLGESIDEALAALAQLWVNGVVIADPAPTGADPLQDPPGGAP